MTLALEALKLAHDAAQPADVVLARAAAYLGFLTQTGDPPVDDAAAKAAAGAALPSITAAPLPSPG